uniref:Small ribosomal subunit protein uS17c n=1 Tax=Spumella sp. Baekdong012001B8 TaxID=2782410 RepID=A0A7S6PV70_9STRA|nr:ribosomal protein S17 [Spumella sp. Baekdong012001B8]
MAKKEILGIVSSNSGKKTIIVVTTTRKPHPNYGKVVTRTKKFMAHDEENKCELGNLVIIEECAPISKKKSWNLKKIF